MDWVPEITRPVLLWMIENNYWPDTLIIHSHNPVDAKWLYDTAKRYAPVTTEVIRAPFKP